MPYVELPTPLIGHARGESRIAVAAARVGEAIEAVESRFPGLKGWILDERGQLREHVNLFVGEQRVTLDRPLAEDDEIYVLQAISGGAPESAELLVGTKKGLFVVRGERGGRMEVVTRQFAGQVVEFATRDRRSGTYFASVTHGQFGPHVYRADDPTGEWWQTDGPTFPEEAGATVERTWVIEPGEAEDELWAGVAPAALFHSSDGGRSWRLNRALWEHPTRPEWEGGLGGLALHTISTWPGDPQRLLVAISAAGVWLTDDGGASWRRGVDGLVPRYLPEEARADTLMHCVHKIERAASRPTTLYMQFHVGVYRSDDGGESWLDIGSEGGLPADFGFPLVAHPRDPECAWVVPLVADVDRVTPEGRLRVYKTTDAGASWRALTEGLPQRDAWTTLLRQAFCRDDLDPVGLYFGTESGEVFASADEGESWTSVVSRLPKITSVRWSG
jgi:photosystem II stability/assembly factor-like uncharacterized protein/molybdopterin converting factor small subunit